ncbi:hypothetical protein A3B57_00550 [Microgenomates group bacterium RIFCSPLOWO2_01_FULL_47_10]|nr:MAG: hypothetical protein A3B57_00550 [Microgenomates group bacterium RIFCSPLOWO2_01_FULL_47_10]
MKSADLKHQLLELQKIKAPNALRTNVSAWTSELENTPGFNPLFYVLRPTALALIFLFIIGSGTAWAAYHSQPGDFLYPVKILAENTLEHILKPKTPDMSDTKDPKTPKSPEDSITNTPPILPEVKSPVEVTVDQSSLPKIKIDLPIASPSNIINSAIDPLKDNLEKCVDCLIPKF